MTLVRPVGLGLASRGDVRDAVGFAERARAAGCESVWFHESYFERDAVTYATAVAASVPDLGVALGALSTYARPTALTAMTVSALDDLAPGRITVALGSALPLRLAQMQIPYEPGVAIEAVRTQLHDLRALWRGERLPRTGVPDLEPMFPPVHRVPLWVAGYRKAFHELAGEAADGYLARPAESIPAIRIAKRPDRGGGAARPGASRTRSTSAATCSRWSTPPAGPRWTGPSGSRSSSTCSPCSRTPRCAGSGSTPSSRAGCSRPGGRATTTARPG